MAAIATLIATAWAALGAQLVMDGVAPSGLDFAADPGQPVDEVSLVA